MNPRIQKNIKKYEISNTGVDGVVEIKRGNNVIETHSAVAWKLTKQTIPTPSKYVTFNIIRESGDILYTTTDQILAHDKLHDMKYKVKDIIKKDRTINIIVI